MTRSLVGVLGDVQDLVGRALGAYDNDRAVSRAELVKTPLEEAFRLCVLARSGAPALTKAEVELDAARAEIRELQRRLQLRYLAPEHGSPPSPGVLNYASGPVAILPDPSPLSDAELEAALALNARCCGYSALHALKPTEGHLVLRCWKCRKTVVEYIGGRFLIRPPKPARPAP